MKEGVGEIEREGKECEVFLYDELLLLRSGGLVEGVKGQ